ncbi:MAG: RecQ family ATP-dependent DNA helicase [Pseudomonadales bacterium]
MGGANAFFTTVRQQPRPTEAEALAAIAAQIKGSGCNVQLDAILADAGDHGWPLAYALAWLSVAGGNSVMPPWVRHQFPEAAALVRRLRDTPCDDAGCGWCRDRHDSTKELKRWFGFDAFRPEPAGDDGRPLQQTITEAAMRGQHVLGILPTGTGKSVCYQIPALSRYDKTGALTVVIAPLVALMADQVAGLEARGITSCGAVNGMLTMPERADVLDRVRLGDIAVLIISPEQLRNRTVRRALAQREIGAWVLDEAHCLSKWGHDFRSDYRYVGRFIRERAGERQIPPILCLTATAKIDVVADICEHFRTKVGVELTVLDGGANRTNLEFVVVPTNPAEKLAHIHQVLEADLPTDVAGGAIVYCASRRHTEQVAEYLRQKGIEAAHFHGALPPETKKDVQARFLRGALRVIAATNAFGMGIDKPDVRLVIHADIPGSLENYLQEAGRAGRDQQQARCVLLYAPDDVEWQFGLSARSRLTRREIAAILRSLRQLDRKKRLQGEVVATPGEILAEEEQGVFERDSATNDTRVRTAVSWLEEAALLTRDENRVQMFPSSLRVASLDEARTKLARVDLFEARRGQLLSLVAALIEADPDEGISTDELMGVSGLDSEGVRAALFDLERLGIASNDTAITAFVHEGVERASRKRLDQAAALERALIEQLREHAPDLERGQTSSLQLRIATQHLRDAGHETALPERVWRLIKSISMDGREESGGRGSLGIKRPDAETLVLELQRDWPALQKTAERRRAGASLLLDHLLSCLPEGARGVDLLVETTLGKLMGALQADLLLADESKDLGKLLDRSLLWLHEQEVIRLNKGLAVFRPAMTIRLAEERRGFANTDFEPLKIHYGEQVVQVHVMAEYAQRGLTTMAEALRLAMDYFRLDRSAFLERWLPDREKDLTRQTTPESWRQIVEALNNPVQQRIVADDREQTNVLVLAGPGSGKTRVLVHRIAYLLRVRRENPRGVLALAYNRHAAVQIRQRLHDLIGDDARGVSVMTCHALAMRLAGVSFAERTGASDQEFKDVLLHAIALLKGEGLPPEEADEQRARLLAGFRWILVDEYQDIGPEQYELISALAGRTLDDDDRRLTLFAVGDDDQNIYGFRGASVEFIRRFESDYQAKPTYLTDNYRSSASIVTAANAIIEPAADRMKVEHPIAIDRHRRKAAPNGAWQALDPVAQGRVQILDTGADACAQAMAVMGEFERLASLDPGWDWAKSAVIAKEWRFLDPVRAYCEHKGIPVQLARDDIPNPWRLRETQALVNWIRRRESKLLAAPAILEWLSQQPTNPWNELLVEGASAYLIETGSAESPREHFLDWLAEWGRDLRRRQTGLLLVTAHSAKGLEFDHVAVLDGGWGRSSSGADSGALRRLYYVAMTRARSTLMLARMESGNWLIDAISEAPHLLRRTGSTALAPYPELYRRYQLLTLRDIDIGYASRHAAGTPVHRAVANMQIGDSLQLRHSNGIQLLDDASRVVGRLSRAFQLPHGMTLLTARVAAVTSRERATTDPKYHATIRTDAWEVVIPELVFGPLPGVRGDTFAVARGE